MNQPYDTLKIGDARRFVNRQIIIAGHPLGNNLNTIEGELLAIDDGLMYIETPIEIGISGGPIFACDEGQVVIIGVLHRIIAQRHEDGSLSYINRAEGTTIEHFLSSLN